MARDSLTPRRVRPPQKNVQILYFWKFLCTIFYTTVDELKPQTEKLFLQGHCSCQCGCWGDSQALEMGSRKRPVPTWHCQACTDSRSQPGNGMSLRPGKFLLPARETAVQLCCLPTVLGHSVELHAFPQIHLAEFYRLETQSGFQ